jgi:hypothetical protein
MRAKATIARVTEHHAAEIQVTVRDWYLGGK